MAIPNGGEHDLRQSLRAPGAAINNVSFENSTPSLRESLQPLTSTVSVSSCHLSNSGAMSMLWGKQLIESDADLVPPLFD